MSFRHVHIPATFDAWRDAARRLLAEGIPPQDVAWSDDRTPSLLPITPESTSAPPATTCHVPRLFVDIARHVACHRDEHRWALLYRVLWRLTHGRPALLEWITDDDVYQLRMMERAVRHDRHKMTAFVRFREFRPAADQPPQYVAWYRPDHFVLRLTASHFRDRFRTMHWCILTPDDSAAWDGRRLQFGLGVPRHQAPADDELESLWLTYYGHIFNPARIKLRMMKKEMPVRFWRDLPEAHIIPQLLADAPQRVNEMIQRSRKLAQIENPEQTVPQTRSLRVLSEAAGHCTMCPLYKPATQIVFGEGTPHAPLMLVGEQPGDHEDRSGKPFVGPAGQLLDDVLEQIGIDRRQIYITNAVKHFKFEQRGERRIHAKPNAREIAACRPWLEKELEIVKPKVLLLLGSTAAQSLIGPQFRITKRRGEVFESKWTPHTLATYHPSALLRVPDEKLRRQMRSDFESDLRRAAALLG